MTSRSVWRRDHGRGRCDARALPASAQDDVAAFYKGKTIQLRVGSAAGGGYDLIARTIARHMGRHIPGTADHRGAERDRRRRAEAPQRPLHRRRPRTAR